MRTPVPHRTRLPLLLAAILLVAGCASSPSMPPVTPSPTNQQHLGMFIWHDLFTADVPAAEAFYGGLLGWRFQRVPDLEGYTLAMLDGRPVAGIVHSPKSERAVWVNHLSVADVDAAVAALVGTSGKVNAAARDFPGRGRVAVVTDDRGALVALTRSANGDPADVLAPVNSFFWTELWAHDPPAHIAMYRTLLGYEIESRSLMNSTYTVLSRDGRPRAGVVQNPFEGVAATWLPQLRVSDPIGYAARARELGARVIVEPNASVRGGTAALVVDPTGAPFGMQQWPLPDAQGGN